MNVRTFVGPHVLFAAILFSGVADAQTTNSSIVGNVFDSSGASVPGAKIVVRSLDTGIAHEAETSATGSYRVFPLNPGRYDIRASGPGFKNKIQPQVTLGIAAALKVDFELELGDVTTTVEVIGAPPLLQTQETSIGGTITTAELVRLPVNGRNYTRLILLMPGTSDRAKSQTNGTFSGTSLYSVNGQRSQDNNYTLDGVENNLFRMNSPGASPPMDAIHEFRVMTGASAEFGRSAGANVNMAIKSGTRDLHGSLYEYLRNDKLDANDFFANRESQGKVPYRQNQYGVSIGGPVILPVYSGRERTFWFFNWEGFRSRRGSTAIGSVPVESQRKGDFSQQSRAIYDPQSSTAGPAGAIMRQSFAGNVIPASRINPASRYTLDTFFPLPNRPGLTSNFVNTNPGRNDRDTWVTRIDHLLTQKDSISFRYLNQKVGTVGWSWNPYAYTEQRFDAHNLGASWTRVLNSASVLEVRFGYHEPFVPSLFKSNVSRSEFLKNTGIKMFQADAFETLPRFDAGEFSFGGNSLASGDHVYQFSTNYSHVLGNHTVRLGGGYSRRQYYYDGSTPRNGFAVFDRRLTELATDRNSGHGTASFLLGYPSRIERGEGFAQTQGRQNAIHVFAQDDWRVTSRLTLNLGLRYELNNPPYDISDQIGTLLRQRDPQTGRYTGRLLWGTVNPEVDPETGRMNEPARRAGFGRSLQTDDFNNFAPRVGIAYQLGDSMVIRAGFGVFYNSTFMQELQDKRKFYPYSTSQTFVANTGVRPDLSITDVGPPYSNTAAIGGNALRPENRTPYSMQWNLFVQRQVARDITIDVGYVGSGNRKQAGYEPFNAALTPGPGPIQPRRLLPEYGDLNSGDNLYNSNYNGLQIKTVKRLGNGLQLQANYTWSRSMDYKSSLAERKTQNPYDQRGDYSRSSWDLRHVFQFAYVWELPFGRTRRFGTGWPKAVDLVLGSWALEGMSRVQTGAPVNVLLGQDRANVGNTSQRPDVLRNPNAGRHTPERWFDTSVFQLPAPYTYGNAGAFIVDSDGRNNWDLSIAKAFRIREGQHLETRAELFNISNSVSMEDPNASFSSSSFGRVTGATSARQIQVSLRYIF